MMDSDVREWQSRLAGKFAAATVNGALVMLRMVLADAVAEFRLPHDPTARIKRMPKRRRPDDDPNVLSAGELGKVTLTGLRVPANDNTAAPNAPANGGSGGDSTSSAVESGLPSP